MRQIFIVTLLIIPIVMSCEKDDFQNDCRNRFYYYNSEKIMLTEIPYQGSVSFYDTLAAETIHQIMEQYQGIRVLSVLSNSNRAVIAVESENCNAADKLLAAVKSDSRIRNCSKFLVSDKGFTLGITDVFACRLKSSASPDQIAALINDNQVEIVKADHSGYYLLSVDKNCNGDALDLANKFFESGFFEYAEPEWIANYGTY